MMTKTRSFQTIGLDWLWSNFAFVPTPGSGDFQMMLSFFAPPQVSGRPFSSAMPCPVGPRQPGHVSPARSPNMTNRAAAQEGITRLIVASTVYESVRVGVRWRGSDDIARRLFRQPNRLALG